MNTIPKLTDLMGAEYPKEKSERSRLVVGTYIITGFEITDVPAQSFKEAVNIDARSGKFSTTSAVVIGQLKGKVGTKITDAINAHGACEIEIVERKYPNGHKGLAIKAF